MTKLNIGAALEKLGKFKILKEVTEGQNSYAFHALHLPLNSEVFLKVIDYSSTFANEALREPRTLVKAMQSFRSPHVVELLDAEIVKLGADEYLCLQMEFVEGKSLLSLIRNGHIGQQDGVRLTAGILNGLAHLHSSRILHRDLKPANIVVDRDGIPKITDFGSVAILAEGQTAVCASKHSALYVPPEASDSLMGYSFNSDLYQVGIVLYELVNGSLEYELQHYLSPKCLKYITKAGVAFSLADQCGQSLAADAVISHLATRERLLGFARAPMPYFSPQLQKIVRKACKPATTERFTSAKEFGARLSQTHVPNWKGTSEGTFHALAWKGWDWELSDIDGIILRKSRPGRSLYRRIAGQNFTRMRDAFTFVELQ